MNSNNNKNMLSKTAKPIVFLIDADNDNTDDDNNNRPPDNKIQLNNS